MRGEQVNALNELRKETDLLLKSVENTLTSEKLQRKALRREQGKLLVRPDPYCCTLS